jgi:starch phosphorylase
MKYYISAAGQGRNLAAHGHAKAKDLAHWKVRMRQHWPQVEAKEVVFRHPTGQRVRVGEEFGVECKVRLGDLAPEEVLVEVYVRPTSGFEHFADCYKLEVAERMADGWCRYSGHVRAGDSGTYRFNVRVIPYHPCMVQKHELRLTCWAV